MTTRRTFLKGSAALGASSIDIVISSAQVLAEFTTKEGIVAVNFHKGHVPVGRVALSFAGCVEKPALQGDPRQLFHLPGPEDCD